MELNSQKQTFSERKRLIIVNKLASEIDEKLSFAAVSIHDIKRAFNMLGLKEEEINRIENQMLTIYKKVEEIITEEYEEK